MDDAAKSDTKTAEESDRPHLREVVEVGKDVVIKAGEKVSHVVVVFGSLTLDGDVESDVVVVGGRAKVNGKVGGQLVAPLCTLELGPSAEIHGDLIAVLGELKQDPQAKVEGERIEFGSAQLDRIPLVGGLKNYLFKGVLLMRPLPHQWGWWWVAALAIAAFYVLVALVFPKAITAGVTALETQPVGSFFSGVLFLMLFGPLNLLLAVTGVGIIISFFLFSALVIAFVFGKIAVYRFVGQQIGRQTGVAALQAPLLALLVGLAVYGLLYMVPVLGFLAWGVAAPLALGAMTLACVQSFKFERVANSRSGNAAALRASGSLGPVTPPIIAADGSPLLSSTDAMALPRVGFWMRFTATLLDLVLVGAVSYIPSHIVPHFGLLAWIAYHIGMWTWKGTTIGGIVMGIKVVRQDGRPVDFSVALVRSLASVFSALVLFLGFFWAGWTRERLAWHDLIAGTMIVKVPRGAALV